MLWVNSEDQLVNCLTKGGTSREKLYERLNGKLNCVKKTSRDHIS